MRSPRIVQTACLAHSVAGGVERAYARSDMLDERREVMQRYADAIS